MQDLTGFTFTQENSTTFKTVYVKTSVFPSAPSSYDSYRSGGIANISPRFRPASSGTTVWGTYDIFGTSAALVKKDMGTWKSIYSPTSGIPKIILRQILQEAGVHIYSTGNDAITANNNWISIHASGSGTKTIYLPSPSSVYNIISNQPIGDNLSQFSFNMTHGDTAIFTVNVNGTFFWKNYTGNHRWDDPANWSKSNPQANIPVGIPQTVIFHSPGGLDNYALIDDAVDSNGGAQAIDIEIGTDGHSSKILQTGGTLKFRNMFIGLHSQAVKGVYEITGGTLKSCVDGTYGGSIILGYSTSADSVSKLIVNGGYIKLTDRIEAGSASKSRVLLNAGTLEAPALSLLTYGTLDFRKGKLITSSKTDFENYILAGKILAYGQTCQTSKFTYTQINTLWHITCNKIASDLDNNGTVNLVDLLTFADEWLATEAVANPPFRADLNGDDAVDFTDFAILSCDWAY
jgi:hypothetical protein